MRRWPKEAGFTYIELLVAVTIFVMMYAGTHGLFTSAFTGWRKGNEVRPLYMTGLTLIDSITRDARSAKNMADSTWEGGTPPTGNNLILVLNFPARRLPSGQYQQKRVTYRNTESGFTRFMQTDETNSKDPAQWWIPGSHSVDKYKEQTWVLSKSVSQFRFVSPDFTNWARVGTYIIFMHKDGPAAWASAPGYQYAITGRIWIRRARSVDDAVTY